jgi:hypothetical protein
MIPEFDESGILPSGVHWAEWSEFQEIFGTSLTRQRMIDGLELAMTQLKAAGCRTFILMVVSSPVNKNLETSMPVGRTMELI